MISVTAIVEGYGDVQALPILLARLGALYDQVVTVNNSIRVGDWKALKAKNSLPKYLDLALSRQTDIILIALDLDDGCPVTEKNEIDQIVDEWKNGRDIIVEAVFLAREYETMFLWSLEDIPAASGFLDRDPDDIRDAKGVLKPFIGRRYKETQDQANFSKVINLQNLFASSRPFRRLCNAVFGAPLSH